MPPDQSPPEAVVDRFVPAANPVRKNPLKFRSTF
jgi:hypothetical protein